MRRCGVSETHLPEHIRGRLWKGCAEDLSQTLQAQARWPRSPQFPPAEWCRPAKPQSTPTRETIASSSVSPSAFGADGKREFARTKADRTSRSAVHLLIRQETMRERRDSVRLPARRPRKSFSLTGAAISGGAARRDCSAACEQCAASVRGACRGRRQMSIRAARDHWNDARHPDLRAFLDRPFHAIELEDGEHQRNLGGSRLTAIASSPRANSTRSSEIEVIVPAANSVAGCNVEFLSNFGPQNTAQVQRHVRQPKRQCFRELRRRSSGGGS